MAAILAAAAVTLGCTPAASAQFYAPRHHPSAPEGWRGSAPGPVTTRTADGLALAGLYWPGREDLPLLVFFHGRSGDHKDAAHYAEPLALAGFPVLLASYRGYGGNPGTPSEDGLARDGQAFLALARSLRPGGRTYLVGHSLGAAVALRVAADTAPAPDGVVTLGAFPDLRSVTPRLFRGLLPDRYSNIDAARRLTRPVVLIQGRYDDVVTFAQAQRLLEATPPGSLLLVLDKQDHRPDLALVAAILPAILAAESGQLDALIAEAKSRTFAIFRKDALARP